MKVAITGANNLLKKKVKGFIANNTELKVSRKPLWIRELASNYSCDCAMLRAKCVFVNPRIEYEIAMKHLKDLEVGKVNVIYVRSTTRYANVDTLNQQADINKAHIGLMVSDRELEHETSLGWAKILKYVQELG